MNMFLEILMISVNDRVCESFAQCDINVALAVRNTAALPEQDHEPIHEGGNRSYFAWQRAFQSDARAALIMGYHHSQTFFEGPSQFRNDHVRSRRPQTFHDSRLVGI